MNNLTDIWKGLNDIVEDYINESISYNSAKEKIEKINNSNELDIKIDADSILTNVREDYNESGMISYDESSYDYYDEESSYDDE